MHHDHRRRDHAGQQREGVEKAQELAIPRAFIDRQQVLGEVERRALQHVAHRHAKQQRGHEAADEQRPVPGRAPGGALVFRAILEAHGAQDQRRQHQEHRQVEARKAHRVERWPGREDRPAAEDEPHLVAFPDRADGVDHDPPLGVGAPDEGQERARAHVEPVGEREADQQNAQQHPPDDAQDVE